MFELFWAQKAQIQQALYVALFLLSLAYGARPERIISGALLGMAAVDALHHHLVGGSIYWRHADVGHMAIDCAMLVVLCTVAVRANRVYPLWIGAAQIIAVTAHIYRIGLEQIDRFAYGMMSVMPSYIQLLAVAVGLAFHMSRHKKLGNYPSWRRSFQLTRPSPAMRSQGA